MGITHLSDSKYIQSLEEEIKKLKEQIESHKGTGVMIQHELTEAKDQIKWLKSDLKSMKEAFALANNWRNAHLDDSKKLDKIEELVNKHNGSDSHARTIFDEIDLMFE